MYWAFTLPVAPPAGFEHGRIEKIGFKMDNEKPILWRSVQDSNLQTFRPTAFETVPPPIVGTLHIASFPLARRNCGTLPASPTSNAVWCRSPFSIGRRAFTLCRQESHLLPPAFQSPLTAFTTTFSTGWWMAAVAGFEPAHRRIKIFCLTSWLNGYGG